VSHSCRKLVIATFLRGEWMGERVVVLPLYLALTCLTLLVHRLARGCRYVQYRTISTSAPGSWHTRICTLPVFLKYMISRGAAQTVMCSTRAGVLISRLLLNSSSSDE
jgi:hypothetical protein